MIRRRADAPVSPSKSTGSGATVRLLPGTLDGAVDRLVLCDLPPGAVFEDDGAATITLHCVLAGTLRVRIGEAAPIRAAPGAALLLPPRAIVHATPCVPAGKRRAGAVRLLIASITPLAAASLGLTAHAMAADLHYVDAAPGAGDLIATLLAEMDRPGLGTVLLASALMKLYLVQAARGRALAEPPGEARIGRAITAVLSDPGAAHSIDSLAAGVRMSRATFIRHFARAAGMNPMQFVAKARLDHAAELLRSTTLPVKVIAAQAGYLDRSHFSRAFRGAHGVDPSNFRSSIRQEGG